MASSTERTTAWWCEACGASGTIPHDEHASVYEVVEQLKEAHATANPDCPTDLARIRVRLTDEAPHD